MFGGIVLKCWMESQINFYLPGTGIIREEAYETKYFYDYKLCWQIRVR